MAALAVRRDVGVLGPDEHVGAGAHKGQRRLVGVGGRQEDLHRRVVAHAPVVVRHRALQRQQQRLIARVVHCVRGW